MAIRLPLCLINRHAPDRRKVRWDGLNFVGNCKYCGRAIRRLERGQWKSEWMPAEAPNG